MQGRGRLPGLTFQHFDRHFHRGLGMAQAVSCGLHHLPEGSGAEGASWGRGSPSVPAHQEMVPPLLPEANPSSHLDLKCPQAKEPPDTTVFGRPSWCLIQVLPAFGSTFCPWKASSHPGRALSSSACLNLSS